MQTWDGIRLDLLALGYRQISYVEVSCPNHGDFRSGVEAVQDVFPCPRCGRACEAAFLAEGFTRRHPLEWEQVAPALPTAAKEERETRAQRYPCAPRSSPAVTAERIALAEQLSAGGFSRMDIARRLFPEQSDAVRLKSSVNVFFHRHRGDIERARFSSSDTTTIPA
jgi:hypothetical protein